MNKLKYIIKKLLPPIFFEIFNSKNNSMWFGHFNNWEEVCIQCSGYDSEIILAKCYEQIQKVKNGTAVYERDSVIFNKIQYSYGLLIGLFKTAAKYNNRISILDFGGSLGSSYFQNRGILKSIKLKWGIVEQQNFVNCGKNKLQTKELMFFDNMEDCIFSIKPNVILLSSVLQYLSNPIDFIRKINDLKIETIIVDRTSFVFEHESFLTIQKVESKIYNATYPCWFFNYHQFISEFSNYDLIIEFDSYCDPKKVINGSIEAEWKGFILNLK